MRTVPGLYNYGYHSGYISQNRKMKETVTMRTIPGLYNFGHHSDHISQDSNMKKTYNENCARYIQLWTS